MVKVKMLWAKTTVITNDAFYPKGVHIGAKADGSVSISGDVSGPGCGVFSCDSRIYMLGIVAQYFLTTGRMPKDSKYYRYLWESEPSLKFHSGYRIMWALTMSGGWFDSPSAKCLIETRQSAHQAGKQIGMSDILEKTLIKIDNEDWALREVLLPHNLKFERLSFLLDRTKDLEIDIEILFIINVEGSGWISFNPGFNIEWPPIEFDIPEWNIYTLEIEP